MLIFRATRLLRHRRRPRRPQRHRRRRRRHRQRRRLLLVTIAFFMKFGTVTHIGRNSGSTAILKQEAQLSPSDRAMRLVSCQLPRNSAETTYTTSPDQTDGMKLEV